MNTSVWLYGDHRAMRVGIGSDADRSDCRCYHVLTLNLLADKPCWRKLGGGGNYDYKHIPAAEKEMREKLHGNIHELTEAETDKLFMDRRSNMFTPRAEAVKVWDEIMQPSPKSKENPMKQQNDRCPLQAECERTCSVSGHERDCDYYRANCLPGMDIPGQEVNTCSDPVDDDDLEQEAYTSACPYFVGMSEPDEKGERKLLCKTRPEPYNGALYDCGCKDDYVSCRLYWLQKIRDEIGDMPPGIERGSVKAMREFYEAESARAANPIEAAPACPADAGAAEQSLSAAGTASLADGPAFDYSGLDAQTVATLHSAEAMIRSARKEYIIKVADAVGMAHDELCGTVVHNVDNGQFDSKEETFRAWCASMGIGKTTAYKLLQVSNLIDSSTPNEQKILKQASASLLYEAAKPSAPAELVRGVKEGDITSPKQYKELLTQLEAEKTARAEAERQAKGLKTSYSTAHANEEYAIKLKREAEQERDGARQALQAAKLRGDKLREENEELKARPIEVKGMDPDEVDRLAQEKADALTAGLRRQVEELESRAASPTGGDANSGYDQVLLANRAMENAWGIAKSAFRQLPADMKSYLAGMLQKTFDTCREELKGLL